MWRHIEYMEGTRTLQTTYRFTSNGFRASTPTALHATTVVQRSQLFPPSHVRGFTQKLQVQTPASTSARVVRTQCEHHRWGENVFLSWFACITKRELSFRASAGGVERFVGVDKFVNNAGYKSSTLWTTVDRSARLVVGETC